MPRAPEPSLKASLKTLYLTSRGLFAKALGLPFANRKGMAPFRDIQHIFCIRIDRVGDMALSTPVFRALKEAWPQARLTVLATPANAPILKNNPHVDEVIVYDRRVSLLEKMRRIRQLRSRRFDLAIDLHADEELFTAFLTCLSRASRRIGFAAFGREIFFNDPEINIEGNRHAVDSLLDLLGKSGILFAMNRKPAIYVSAEEKKSARQWLDNRGLLTKSKIAIHPGAYYATQRWPAAHYGELIDLIRCRSGSEVILMGGPSDGPVIEEVLASVKGDKRELSVYNNADLRGFIALLAECQLLVCNNSGPLHCAVALNVPTISFMGPTVKENWAPIGSMHHVLRIDELPCIGCNLGTCKIKTHDCMRLITPERVLELMRDKAMV